ncbi:hypothetical protein H6784_02075 [Candidatus Nomurabacteria bacterium]|nr:hypothetical protein [Candidatus Nomurabacteria bacterium]
MSSIDQERNNISLTNVITQINIPDAEFVKAEAGGHKGLMLQSNHELVIMFRRMGVQSLGTDDLNTDIKISLVDPIGGIVGEILNTVTFLGSSRNHGHRINMSNFTVTTEGDYEYRVSIFNQELNEFEQLYFIPFTVERIKK